MAESTASAAAEASSALLHLVRPPAGLTSVVNTLTASGWRLFVDRDLGSPRNPFWRPFEHDAIAFAPRDELVVCIHLVPAAGGRLEGEATARTWLHRRGAITQAVPNPLYRAQDKVSIAVARNGLDLAGTYPVPVAVVGNSVDISAVAIPADQPTLIQLADLVDWLEAERARPRGTPDPQKINRAIARLMTIPATPRDDLTPLNDAYELERVLALVGESVLLEARDRATRRRFAVAVGPVPERGDAYWPGRESQVLQRSIDPHQARAPLYLSGGRNIAVAIPIPDGPRLSDALGDGALPLDAVHTLALAVARQLEAWHAVGVIHQDLRPEHVFLGPPMRITGLSFCRIDERAGGTGFLRELRGGGDPFVAPEIRSESNGRVAACADAFGWGMIVAAACLQAPTPDDPDTDWLRMCELDAVDEAFVDLVRQARSVDPEERPTPAALVAELERLAG